MCPGRGIPCPGRGIPQRYRARVWTQHAEDALPRGAFNKVGNKKRQVRQVTITRSHWQSWNGIDVRPFQRSKKLRGTQIRPGRGLAPIKTRFNHSCASTYLHDRIHRYKHCRDFHGDEAVLQAAHSGPVSGVCCCMEYPKRSCPQVRDASKGGKILGVARLARRENFRRDVQFSFFGFRQARVAAPVALCITSVRKPKWHQRSVQAAIVGLRTRRCRRGAARCGAPCLYRSLLTCRSVFKQIGARGSYGPAARTCMIVSCHASARPPGGRRHPHACT